ncbi:bifunctional DNA primase/polymerase [Sinomonas sp. B1-1]|uniref:bifunctional DNA primase/polymerase n=1 Tax=Sinomonas sp. B1-1 TaxID=3141454 RepID=UPI003D284D8F
MTQSEEEPGARVAIVLDYARRGFPVFPLRPGSKAPATRNGFKDASTDEAAIRSWWEKTPRANIGLPTGRGFDVIDIDGERGERSWREMQELGFSEVFPTIAEVRTPRGRHVYVAPTTESANATNWWPVEDGGASGIDVRGVGGYVVAPPSVLVEGADGVKQAGVYEGERDAESGRRLLLTRASQIRPQRVKWLWEGRMALGTLALLAGRQGLGKSTLAYWLAAQITRGALPGEFEGVPKAVLVCATEDDWEHTIVPRLIAADADLEKVYRVEVVNADEVHVGLSLPRDNHGLEQAARETDAALLLLDPLISRLGDLDTHRDAEVRQALEPLVAVASRTRMAVLGLIHHNKSGATDPLQLVMGSTAFSAVARSVHSVIPDPDDDTNARRLFGTPKNNLGRADLPTLAFTVETSAVQTDDGTAWTGCLVWRGEHDGSIADAIRQARDENGGDRSATAEAADWVRDYLVSRGGSAPSADLKREGIKAGHTVDAVKRARRRLGLSVENVGFPRRSYWSFAVGAQSEQSLWGESPTTPTAPTDAQSGLLEQSEQSERVMDVPAPTEISDLPNPDGAGHSKEGTEP